MPLSINQIYVPKGFIRKCIEFPRCLKNTLLKVKHINYVVWIVLALGLNSVFHSAKNMFYHYNTPQGFMGMFLKVRGSLHNLNLKETLICSDESILWEIKGDVNN